MPAQKKIMFEFLREWTKSTAVKRQETLNAYLDGELSPRNRDAFERLLANDAALQQELADQQLIKSQLRQLPRVAVPRNFILDATKYQKPAKRPLITYYPVLRGATALTAVIFIFTLGWSMMGSSGGSFNSAPAQESAMEVMVEAVEEMAAEEIVEEEIEIPAEPKIAETERMPADGAAEAEEAPPEGVFEEAADEEMANAADIIEDITEDAAASAPAEDVEEEAESVVDEVEETEADSPLIEMPAGEGVDMDMADDVMATATVVMETAVSTTTPTPPPHAQPESAPSPTLTNTQLAQISLLILFVILLTLTLYARQKR